MNEPAEPRLPFRAVTGSRVHTRPFLQAQTTECPVAALGIVLDYHGRHVSMEELRRVSGVSRDCLNAAEMLKVARELGLEGRGMMAEVSDFARIGFPLIAHLRFIHFVVVEGIARGRVYLNDPACGHHDMALEEFDERFTGIVLKLEPAAALTGGRPVAVLAWLWQALRGRALELAGIAAASLLLALPTIAAALFLGRLVDAAAAPAAASAFGVALLLAAAALVAGALAWVRDVALARIDEAFSNRCGAVLRHLLRLPFAFFIYRLPGNLMHVVLGQHALGRLVTGSFARAVCDAGGVLLLAAAMLAVEPRVGLICVALGGALLVASRRLVHSGARRYAQSLGLSGLSAASFERMEMYQTGGLDDEYFAALSSQDARRQSSLQRYEESRALARQALPIAQGLVSAVVLGWGGYLLLHGLVGAGPLIALLLLSRAFLARTQALVSEEGEIDEMRAQATSQAEAESIPSEAAHDETNGAEGVGGAPGPTERLEGVLSLRDVSFGHSPNKPPVVAGITLEVRPGKQMGITGSSGSGKSTLAGLMAGLHRPWSGRVELAGVSLSAVAPEVRARSIGWIGKTPAIFEGSLRENLSLWNPALDESAIRAAAADACLEDVVAGREGGLEAHVEARGTNLSAGQRQRLEIARALLLCPKVLVLDEAVDAIEPELELRIRERLSSRGCTLVLVSQRASTLEACDEVIRVEQGRILRAGQAISASQRPTIDSPMHTPQPAPARPREAAGAGARIAALRCVAEATGIAVALDAEDVRGAEAESLAELCRRAGVRVRRVRLVPSAWWRTDCGALLGLAADGAQPVALLPRDGGYDTVDPRDGRRERLDAEGAGRLERHAYALYAPFPDLLTRPWRVLWHSAVTGASGRDWSTAALAALALGALAVAAPLAAWLLLGRVIPGGDPTLAVRLAASLLLAAAASALFGLVHGLALARARGRSEHAALAATWDRLVRLPVAFLRRQRPAELAGRCAGLPQAFSLLAGAALAEASTGAVALVALLMGIAWIRPAFLAIATAIFLVPLPLALLVTRRAQRDDAGGFARSVAQRLFLFDLLRGMARLRSANADRRMAEIWQRVFGECLVLEQRERARRRPQLVIDEAYPLLAQAALASAIALGFGGPLAVPSLAALVLAFHCGAEAALAVARAGASIVAAHPLLRRLEPVFEAPLGEAPRARASRLRGAIEARDLAFRYDGALYPALDGVSLRVEPGELVAIAGPSGGGKSTLLRVLLGFERADRGSVAYDAHLLGEVDVRSLRAQMGAVLQEDQLTTGTLRYNLAGTSSFTLDEVWEAARLAAIDAEIRALPMGMQTITEDGLLSSGQKQRILIAARLLRRPRLLFLDEATSALSDAVEREILHNIRALGITCLYVAHRPSAVRHADRVYVIDRGRVAQTGTAENALGRGLLARLHAQRGAEEATP